MAEQRVDILLVAKQLARSRTEAQKMIAAGQVVRVESGAMTPVKKPSEKFLPDVVFQVSTSDEQRYVSRAGLKLEHALATFNVAVSGLLALDIGQSTGGFTECLLARGAHHVVGVEVGHGQLAPSLRDDARVTCIEGYNARVLQRDHLPVIAQAGIDLIVMDVSFISQHLILPNLPVLLKPQGAIVSLVKPQFEVGREGLGKKGIVKDPRLYGDVEQKIRLHCQQLGLTCLAYTPSPILGGDGNREFLFYARAAR